MKRLILILCAVPVFAASPQSCGPALGVTTLDNNPNSYASTPGGTAGTCTSSGGTSVSYRGTTITLNTGVPGAAGSKDRIVLPSSGSNTYTLSIPMELGDPSASATVAALTIGSTSTLVVNDGVLLSLRGYGTVGSGTGGIGVNNGTLQALPGSAIWWDTAGAYPNNGEWQDNTLPHIGCGDIVKASTAQCTENAGAWESVSAASPGVWTAGNGTTQPTGWHVGDLVEIDPIPQPLTTGTGTYGPPYAPFPCTYTTDAVVRVTYIKSCTAPTDFSAPPTYPITTDSATCNTLASCAVPIGIPLCIVNKIPLELGWTTSLAGSCVGAVAMNISDAGTGWMWMKKPAFFWGLPSNLTWNVSQSLSGTIPTASFDAIESAFSVYGPISNAAGTGPGRKGDNSLVVSSLSITPSTGTTYTSLLSEKDRPWQLAQNGDYYVNYQLGDIFLYGGYINGTFNATWKTLSNNPLRTPHFTFPGTCTTGREFLMENADVEYLFSNASGSVPAFDIHDFCTTTPTASFRWEHNTMRNNGRLLNMTTNVGTALSPITMNSNAHYNSSTGNPGANQDSQANFSFLNNGNSYLDYSNNYIENHYGEFYCTGTNNQSFTNPNLTLTNDVGYYERLLTCSGAQFNNKMPDLLIQRIRATTDGNFDAPTEPGFEATVVDSYMGTPGHPAVFEWNHLYGQLRGMFYDSYSSTRYNYQAWLRHHGSVANAASTYITGVEWAFGICAEKGHDDGCAASGYDANQWLDGPLYHNITATGMANNAFSIGDQGDASNIFNSGLGLFDNVLVTDSNGAASGAIDLAVANQGASITMFACQTCGFNSLYGAGPPYVGSLGTIPPAMIDPVLHRFTNAKQGGVPYNTSGMRNIGGVSVQNPTYTGNTVTSGTLAFVRTSATNATFSWDDGLGTGPGTAQQLNWSGSGVTWTPTGLSESGDSQIVSLTMPSGWGTPTDRQAGCPDQTWAIPQTGAAAGRLYSLIRCGGGNYPLLIVSPVASNNVAITPDAVLNGYASEPIVIDKSVIILPNGDGSQSITIGIDPRGLPATSQTDTGISINLVDYCASGCAATLNPAIPGATQNDSASFLWGTATGSGGNAGTNSPVNCSILEPMRGGNMVTAFQAGSCYIPTGTAWKTAGHARGPIGATETTPPVVPTLLIP